VPSVGNERFGVVERDADRANPATVVQPFSTIGVAAIVVGGIVAALTGPTGWEQGSWVAAFLVLVVGVGQIGLAAGQAALADHPPSSRRRAAQAGLFNAGAGLVIAGTLASNPIVVTVGGAAVLAALILFAWVRQRRVHEHTWPARAYLLLLVVLVLSTPVGLVLAWLRQ
jgi:hypothetical protein